jgi:hypothetical protein
MDKIETPEEVEILKFLNDLADYCIPVDGGKMRMQAQVWPIVKARDAFIRADERQKAAESGRSYVYALDIGTAVDLDQLVAALPTFSPFWRGVSRG